MVSGDGWGVEGSWGSRIRGGEEGAGEGGEEGQGVDEEGAGGRTGRGGAEGGSGGKERASGGRGMGGVGGVRGGRTGGGGRGGGGDWTEGRRGRGLQFHTQLLTQFLTQILTQSHRTPVNAFPVFHSAAQIHSLHQIWPDSRFFIFDKIRSEHQQAIRSYVLFGVHMQKPFMPVIHVYYVP